MAAINWVVTEFYIDKNWKLEDWNEKNVKVRWSILFAFQKIQITLLEQYYQTAL